MREALSLVANCMMGNVIAESDCLELVRACRSEIKLGEISSIIHDIQFFKNENPNIGITWTPRKGNEVAHNIALLGFHNAFPYNWVRFPPPSLKILIEKEKRSCISSTEQWPMAHGLNQLMNQLLEI